MLYCFFDLGVRVQKLLRENPVLEHELFLNHFLKNSPINIRYVLYRGRTEATKTWYTVKQGGKIRFIDVIRHCPYICKYGKLPLGHPKVYLGKDCLPDSFNRNRIIKCNVLPPRKMYHLVLTYKSNSKLMFPFCYVCADNKN